MTYLTQPYVVMAIVAIAIFSAVLLAVSISDARLNR
ncbi:hypothetical protein FHS92_001515 [Sphingobium subterraneum]|uniref:Uncharacterized protein n=1 Tax=Sphingobium subterraneum TaxID=627688 RepID=A0A841J2N4_9SPHN|nr:hypothetical protein [Sphingobium subterraneum]